MKVLSLVSTILFTYLFWRRLILKILVIQYWVHCLTGAAEKKTYDCGTGREWSFQSNNRSAEYAFCQHVSSNWKWHSEYLGDQKQANHGHSISVYARNSATDVPIDNKFTHYKLKKKLWVKWTNVQQILTFSTFISTCSHFFLPIYAWITVRSRAFRLVTVGSYQSIIRPIKFPSMRCMQIYSSYFRTAYYSKLFRAIFSKELCKKYWNIIM